MSEQIAARLTALQEERDALWQRLRASEEFVRLAQIDAVIAELRALLDTP